MFKTWLKAKEFQNSHKSTYDNGFEQKELSTDVVNIDRIPYVLGDVVWVIMADDFYLDGYEESATEYGVTKDGKWAAIYDGHCSCYGWEANDGDITYYDSYKQLLEADPKAKIIEKYKAELKQVYPFLKFK